MERMERAESRGELMRTTGTENNEGNEEIPETGLSSFFLVTLRFLCSHLFNVC